MEKVQNEHPKTLSVFSKCQKFQPRPRINHPKSNPFNTLRKKNLREHQKGSKEVQHNHNSLHVKTDIEEFSDKNKTTDNQGYKKLHLQDSVGSSDHLKYMQRDETDKSAVVEHACTKHHMIKWSKAKIIYSESHLKKTTFKDATFI